MKIWILFLGVLSCWMATGAQEPVSETKTEKLGESLWRVRVRRGNGPWPESGLNRYGILERLPVLETGTRVDFGRIRPDWRLTAEGFELKFPLAEGERVYGLGDSSRVGIQRRPGVYEMYVKNVNSYIPIPMAWSSRGWGVLVNTTWLTRFDVGQSDPGALTVTAPRGELDFYVFTGRNAEELLDVCTRLTGRPAMLPIWGYGFTFVCNQYVDQFELMNEAQAFREKRLPCDVIGLESGWMETFYDFTTRKRWDSKRFFFPYWSPKGERTFPFALKRLGFKLSLWLCCNYDLFRFEEEQLKKAA